ncbi:MAG TPA: RteC domain-containing protein, partial [Puia sp.]
EHPFVDQAEEIRYFKTLAPPVYGRLVYLVKVAETSIERLHANEHRIEALLQQELAKTEEFFVKHGEFCQYYHLNRTYRDNQIFIRNARENEMLDYIEVFMGDDFCVGCYWASQLWANQWLREYFNKALSKLKQPEGWPTAGARTPEMTWTDSISDLVELLYALSLKGSFNNGKATLKDIARWASAHFKIEITNVYDTVKNIGQRKKDGLKFLDDLRNRAARGLDSRI